MQSSSEPANGFRARAVDHRDRRGVPAAAAREPVAVRGRRHLLRRDLRRSAAVRRRGSDRGRRRELGRPGGGVPGADRRAGCTCWCDRRAGRDHVALSGPAASRRIPAIDLHTRTEIVGLEGNGHLERVRWREHQDGPVETARHQARLRDDRRVTEHRLARRLRRARRERLHQDRVPISRPTDLAAANWPLRRAPHLLETSLPGVFAVGDVRGGNVKRVASAVGEGSIAVSFVHQVLRE